MPPRIWFAVAIIIVACGIPCSAQKMSSPGSHVGGFGRGPGFTHMGSPGFSQRGDASRFSVRSPAFSRFPRSQSVPTMSGSRESSRRPQFFRSDGMGRGSRWTHPLVPRPSLQPSPPMASSTSVVPRPSLVSATPIRAAGSVVPRPPQASVVRAEASAVPHPPRTSEVPVQAAISATARPPTRFGTNGQILEKPRSRVLLSSRQFSLFTPFSFNFDNFNPFFLNPFLFPRPFFFSFSPFFPSTFFFSEPFFFSPFLSNPFFFPGPFFFSPFLINAFFPQPFFFSFGSSTFFFGSPFLSSPFVPFTFRSGAIEHHLHLFRTSELSFPGSTRRQP